MPGRRPIIGPMTPGIELAQRIEQAQILVIVDAPDIFTDWTSLPDWLRDAPVLASTRRLAARAMTQFLRECASARSN